MQHPHRPQPLASRHGFTLLEMAVVVSVIGLLIGGVLVGKNMYRTAKLQGISVTMGTLAQSTRTFIETYGYMPGDMPNATSIWGLAGGTAAANNAACNAVDSTTLADIRRTCNGNGDGAIDNSPTEVFRGQQHLANAGLIAGRFTGKAGSSGVNHAIAGTNLLAGPLSGTGFVAHKQSLPVGGSTSAFALPYIGHIRFGTAGLNMLNQPAISPSELSSIDTKIDDSLPHRGDVIALMHQTCTNSLDFAAPDVYTLPETFDGLRYLQSNSIGCAIIYRNQY